MGREAKGKRPPALPKVERVELNEKHIGRRFIAFVLCLALGLSALGFGFYSLLTTEPGWARIEATSDQAYVAGDFAFDYLFGEGATAQRKALTTLYTQQCIELGKLFDTTRTYEDCPYNLSYINTHPGKDITVDPRLYNALERMEAHGKRSHYLGLLNAYYLNLYYEDEDIRSGQTDPLTEPATEELMNRLYGVRGETTMVRLEMLGDNTLRLEIDPEYMEFAKELGLDCWLDLGWFKNAFILDCLSEELSSRGYTQGIIYSRDGFVRSLGGDVGPVRLSMYEWNGTRAVETEKRELDTPVNAAARNGFPISGDDGRAYVHQSALRGTIVLMGVRPHMTAGEWAETVLEYSDKEDCVGLALKAAFTI